MKTITEQTYVDHAEKVILNLQSKKDKRGYSIPMVTTSKIRNLLAMTSDIYTVLLNHQGEEIPDEIRDRIEYLRIRFVYESGRERSVKQFVEEAGILDVLKEIGRKKSDYILYNRYMEALVAFHKYHGGKEQ